MSFKKNNKGFTLVELIIVIAIIAILAVVVAPQYLKYVESSRVAVDKNAIDEIAHAAEVAAIGDGSTVVGDGSFTINISNTGVATLDGTANDLSEATLGDGTNIGIIDLTKYTFKSTTYRDKSVIITVTNGVGSASDPA